MRRPAVAALLLACALAARASAEEPIASALAPLFDAGSEQVVQKTFVPSEEQKVGEVRLLRRGDTTVVQTLLYTRVLARVVAEIRNKELANWPAAHPDSARYVDLLGRVQKQIWDRMPRSTVTADRRQKLFIEFAADANRQLVAIGSFEMDETGSNVRVLRREPLASFEPSREYALRNMRLIAADSFHADGAALEALLTPFPLLRSGDAK